MPPAFDLFSQCTTAIQNGRLIERASRQDKEFHFQHWVRDRLAATGLNFDEAGRNTYPDLLLVNFPDGFEVKGLAYPGRESTYDCNSQVPTGLHNGRTVHYVFGRYPKKPDGNSYPVLDLVVCHGDFLNADHEYAHKNKPVRGFGSYGDIMIRDRKMYVAPTPFGLLEGAAHRRTLIVPEETEVPKDYQEVGIIVRREVDERVVKYDFDLRTNELKIECVPNPNAGREHVFRALRLATDSDEPISLKTA
ncbi:MAG: hypothetical protein WBC73_22165 [Phormidesmis sp.]